MLLDSGRPASCRASAAFGIFGNTSSLDGCTHRSLRHGFSGIVVGSEEAMLWFFTKCCIKVGKVVMFWASGCLVCLVLSEASAAWSSSTPWGKVPHRFWEGKARDYTRVYARLPLSVSGPTIRDQPPNWTSQLCATLATTSSLLVAHHVSELTHLMLSSLFL